MECDCCGTTRNVTYHPKINMALCKNCQDIIQVILGSVETKKHVPIDQIKRAVKCWYRHIKEA